MAVVVFLLFAIGMAGAAGYQLVRLEWDMAVQNSEANEALAVATAGLQRFMGESYGVPGDSVSYFIGDGTAVVRTRLLASFDSVTDLYLVRSEAEVQNPVYPESPARRVVSQYALLHKDPIGLSAALVAPTGTLTIGKGGSITGFDASTAADCTGGGVVDLPGTALTVAPGGGGGGGKGGKSGGFAVDTADITGTTDYIDLRDFAEVYDSARVRWDVVSDAGFSIRDDGSPPNFGAIPADSYPVVRATGNLNAGSSWAGRGVLIVPGDFGTGNNFDWDGIVLAGGAGRIDGPGSTIDGLLIVGLDDSIASLTIDRTTITYHYCHALAAMRSLAYLEPLEQTWWEGY